MRKIRIRKSFILAGLAACLFFSLIPREAAGAVSAAAQSQTESGSGQTGLALKDGTWYYMENGSIGWSYTGLVKYGSTWYYVEKGRLNWNYTGLVKYGNTWYYVEKGRLNWNYTGLVKYGSTWYYVEKGRLNWNYTGLVKYGSTWYYVEKGRLNWNYTGLVKYGSTWYYVEKGRLNWKYSGLVKRGNTWYYVEKGRLNWNYTGLAERNETLFYVRKGRLDWNYSGTVRFQNVQYQVVKGIAEADTGESDGNDREVYVPSGQKGNLLVHARANENGGYRGGKPGDQTGKEVVQAKWFSQPWNYVIRPKSSKTAERLAAAMERAAANDRIGYDMSKRNTLYQYASKVGYDPAKVKQNCSVDCSSLVVTALCYAGVDPKLVYQYGNCLPSSMIRSALVKSGMFRVYTGSAYTRSTKNLKRGDILLAEGRHVAVVSHTER